MAQEAVDNLQKGLLHTWETFLQQLLQQEKKRENSLYIVLLTHCNCDLAPFSCTHLCHISDQTQGDIRESFVKISTHHIDPREAVSCVGVGFIQSHDMSKVGKLGVVLLKAYLHTQRCVSLRCEICEMKKRDKNGKPVRSSQQPPDRTVWGHQSSVPDEGAGREHSKENLVDKKTPRKTKQMTLI